MPVWRWFALSCALISILAAACGSNRAGEEGVDRVSWT
jgi:hypothetical protein